jgi:hypothetical protein
MNLNKQLPCESFIKYNNLENTTMISPKWAVLVAAFALVGAISIPPTAFAQQSAETEIERNNEISQSIEQSQEACTNEADAEIDDEDVIDIGGDNSVSQDQENDCDVTQDQDATNAAVVVDDSENEIGVGQVIGLDFCALQFDFPQLAPFCEG